MNKTIKVLIVDDSALIRQILTEILSSDKQIEVVATASDPLIAREKIKLHNPDVITLDVEMPKMDGITFLRNLMRLRPMPVVMVSSLTEAGADVTFEAIELGAVDYVTKPKIDMAHGLREFSDEIIAKVKMAAGARVRQLDISRDVTRIESSSFTQKFKTTNKIIAIGASTGGTEAIKEVLIRMPPDAPAIVITQHIPELFSAAFARRMDSCSQMAVCEASDGQQILPGHVYIAPGSAHLKVSRSGARFFCCLDHGDPVNRHRPSVEVLFRSVAEQLGKNAIGVMLTGMGSDGAVGMKDMHDAGAYTIAQDEKSSVVWGMPGSAVQLGCVDEVIALDKIAARVLSLLQ